MTRHPLQDVPLFADFPDATLIHLMDSSRVRTYPAGQILWNEGDPGDALVILEEGQIRISRMTSTGQEVVLAVLEPPACLGELALIDGAPRDATATAQRAVTVRLIPRSAFLQALTAEPAAQMSLIRVLVGMVRDANTRHSRTVGLDVPGRLAAWLLGRAGEGIREPVVSLAGRSQTELAAELSTTRSTLNRALRDFEDLQLIRVADDQVTILDRAHLNDYTR